MLAEAGRGIGLGEDDGVTVLIADDHALVRQALRTYLEAEADFHVIGEASDGREVLGMVAEGTHPPNVVLLDVRMPEMGGLETARRILAQHPGVAVIMLSAYDEHELVVEAVRAGALGYVLKNQDAAHLIRAVRLVSQGNMVIDPNVVAALAEGLSSVRDADRRAQTLTIRELEVLQHLASGEQNREIAEALFCSLDTVKTHVEHIFDKLGASDRTAAVAEALRRHIIE